MPPPGGRVRSCRLPEGRRSTSACPSLVARSYFSAHVVLNCLWGRVGGPGQSAQAGRRSRLEQRYEP
eukprot:8245083-Alexandrium_andersonii.AAC.1